ncbi:helix-turn-helix domain-containing protein [Achromobacter deleyi]|uniref:helix-turn-helix domain-containing protein n=1 Tax=Achromobacter deleyi TaxID=1353891 RepID=UPI001492C8E6|nr:AraC family transcriptional regulator [Achromobacter deleyi]QVQ27865.1 helix-turn-helix transcriptional regulator [Achromobacter deleyi]UIP23472.1 AraC family transcriptional regulator [Achromobacter deleyi]
MPTRVSSTLAQARSGARPGWQRHALPQDLGDCHADRLDLDDGLTLVHSQYTPARDLIEESAAGQGARTLVITLAMQGASAYRGADGSGLDFRGGHTTVTAFQRSPGERRYLGGAAVSQLRLLVDERILRRYAGDERADGLLGGGRLRCLAQGRSTPDLAAAAVELAGSADPLDAHIRALTLLARQLRCLAPAPQDGRLSQADIARLEAARALMQEQMDRELTVQYLCLATGLNEFKLKEGFRQLYGNSPHRLLTELRMRRAWELLESGCQVAQAAYRVGYRHPANFSAAFTRFHGRAPKSVFGKRR